MNSDWLIPYKEGRPGAVTQPPEVYFCQSKLDVWSHVADQAIEALASCKQHLGQFLENTHRDIVSQLTGMQQTFYFYLFCKFMSFDSKMGIIFLCNLNWLI